MSGMVERIARAICASGKNGFCDGMGVHMGCRNGRGLAPSFANCKATIDQLYLIGAMLDTKDVLAAMREPTEAMSKAGEYALLHDPIPTNEIDEANAVYRRMIDRALGDDHG